MMTIYHCILPTTCQTSGQRRVIWKSIEDTIRSLTERANGLFVWASIGLAFITKHDPRKRLETILKKNRVPGAEAALDALYQTALESVGMWDDEDFIADFRRIIGMLLVLRGPLSGAAIDKLLGSTDGPSSIDTVTLLGYVVSHPASQRQEKDFKSEVSNSGEPGPRQ
jgi:hypothetical protein